MVLIRHRIYEDGRDYPIVEHIFRGPTQEQAEMVFMAHLAADNFLRGCQCDGFYRGIVCWAETSVELEA